MARHGVLGARLRHFNQVYETSLALFETANYGLLGILGEILILDDVVMEVVPEVVSTGSAPMSIEDSEETDLRPVYI